MVGLAVGALLLVLLLAARAVLRRRRERWLRATSHFRLAHRLAEEDVTALRDELAGFHPDPSATGPSRLVREAHDRALTCCEEAGRLLRQATTADDVCAVTAALGHGWLASARAVAHRDGSPLPDARPPCFFDPRHGSSSDDVPWSPPGGVERRVGVCRPDAQRLARGEVPAVRTVRAGDRWVPWYAAGEAYDPYARGYFDRSTDEQRAEAARIMAVHPAPGARVDTGGTDRTAGVGPLGQAPAWPHHRMGRL